METVQHDRVPPVLDPTPRWKTAVPYTVLKSSHIRLLQIEQWSVETGDQVECTLSVHDLSTAPSFSALSYTWGLPHRDIHKLRKTLSNAKRQIKCNGFEGQVGENLYDFLVHCAQDLCWDPQGYLWIDALCIDQGNIQERSEQVKLMSRVYQTAMKIIVWLGPEDDSTEPAMYLIKRVVELDESERLQLNSNDVSKDHSNPLLNSGRWQALAQFFQREWFNRAWIIQEVVLARSVTILCDRHSISWAQLSLFSQFLATSSWTLLLKKFTRLDEHGRAIGLGHNTPARLAAAQKTWLYGDDNKFLYALIRARSSVSENIRDKVFSQLGIGEADIFPDYKASVAEVYTLAAEYILKHSRSLLVLACVEGEEFQQVPGLPSWVPDWSVDKCIGLRITGYPDFHAALDLPKQYMLSKEDDGSNVLTIKATELDEIVDVSETKRELRDKLHASTFWEMISKLDASYVAAPTPGQSREEAVWRALMTNREAKGTHTEHVNSVYPASSEFLATSFHDWVLWRYATTAVEPTVFPSTRDSLIPNEAELCVAREQSKRDPEYLADLARRATLYDVHYSHAMLLRPFITKHGYFGIGTLCLRIGDVAWVVPGCPVPLILRRIEGSERFRLVGGAYVHGFMNGEILERDGLVFRMISLE